MYIGIYTCGASEADLIIRRGRKLLRDVFVIIGLMKLDREY